MRLIGNKTKLLGEIEKLLSARSIESGTLIDIFSGTSSVGRYFKRRGFRIIANDYLSACYTQAVAGIEASSWPSFEPLRRVYAPRLGRSEFRAAAELTLRDDRPEPGRIRRGRRQVVSSDLPESAGPLAEVVCLLNREIEPRHGLVHRNFCPGGTAGRQYFTDENGARIDGILEFLRVSRAAGLLDRVEFHLLLSALVDAADRVANISGTYGAYLKSWQASAEQPLWLRVPRVIESHLEHEAHREDSNRLVPRLAGDVLYVDPPYNRRQYAANYHVLEILAEYHRIDDLDRYEDALYGKTGLRPYDHLRSAYCVPTGRRRSANDVLQAFRHLILSSDVRHVVVSYNEEGLLDRDQIGEVLAEFVGRKRFDFDNDFRQIIYRRFRSDSDRDAGHDKGVRSYRVVRGRKTDEIGEWLFIASRRKTRSKVVVPELPLGGLTTETADGALLS